MGRQAQPKNIDLLHAKRVLWCQQLFPHFQKYGLKAFGMDQVALALGKSKTTVYKYFKSREDILEQMIGQKLGEASSFQAELSNKDLSFEKRYSNAVSIFSQNIKGISNLFLKDLKKFHPVLWEQVFNFQFLALGFLEEFYREGLAAGSFEGELKSFLISDQIIFSALLNPDFLIDQKTTLQEALQDYLLLKCFGMLARG
ncbi:MAG: TetR/AcrR family transcriptional regulator [Halobacteriovoraceae bacterium]|jgi:AcrR family transcriptional regulator|nr:TetR/AcrR family transcriptional regulator [Halobacteriovoraceae bacterium]MBT5093196.1 TetR/AcrR family transcriptional regulator [Halobacteriovoraceae bacterium]